MDPLGQKDVTFFSVCILCPLWCCSFRSFYISSLFFYYVLLFSSSSRLPLSRAPVCSHRCSLFVCFYRQSCALFWKWPFSEKKSCILAFPRSSCGCVCAAADNSAHQRNHQCLADVCPQKCLALFPVVFPLWKWHHSYKNLAFVLPLSHGSQVWIFVTCDTFNLLNSPRLCLFNVQIRKCNGWPKFSHPPSVQNHPGPHSYFFPIVVWTRLEILSGDPEAERKSYPFNASAAPSRLRCGFLNAAWSSCISDVCKFAACNVFLLQDSQVRPSTTYSLHQPQGNKEHGTERSGYLYKKSDGWAL